MYAIIFAGSRLQFYRGLADSLLALPLLFHSRTALHRLARVTAKARAQYESNDFFLFWVFVSQLLQFLDAFVYSFSFTSYFVWAILGVILYGVARVVRGFTVSDLTQSDLVGFGIQAILRLDVVLLFWTLLSIRSDNNCGQIHLPFYAAYFLFIGVFLGGLCRQALLKTQTTAESLTRELLETTPDSFLERDLAIQQRFSLRTLAFLRGALAATAANCLVYPLFLLWKYPLNDPSLSCPALLASLSGPALLALAVLEFFLRNAVPFFVFYIYYWRVRKVLAAEVELARLSRSTEPMAVVAEEED